MNDQSNFRDSRGAREALGKARELLLGVSPLKSDCGRLCSRACCQSDETGDNGMALFPLEDELIGQSTADFAFRLLPEESLFSGGWRLVCQGRCERARRPLSCMVFPLRIRVERDGTSPGGFFAKAEIDPRAWAVCPLLEMGGLRAMDSRFVAAVEQAGNIMLQSPPLREALLREQRLLDEARRF